MHKIENWQAATGHDSTKDNLLLVSNSLGFICAVAFFYNDHTVIWKFGKSFFSTGKACDLDS